MTKKASQGEITFRRYIRCKVSRAAEPWGCATRGSAVLRCRVPYTDEVLFCAANPFRLFGSLALPFPIPFRFESAVEGTKLFDNAQSPPTKPVE